MRILKMSVLAIYLIFWGSKSFAALPASQQYSLAPMLATATSAVVNISTEGRVELRFNPLFNDPFFKRFFNFPDQRQQRKTQSLGSGVIIDSKRGLIVTNYHVIKSADVIKVKLSDGRILEADLVGSDSETDIAVLRIKAKNIVSLELFNSDKLRVGDFVVAIGNPFGLGQTVTSGIVSALARSGLGIIGYEDLIQTDASINPGNSGGALVNLDGKLIGINTAIYSQSGGNIGIGFAIPSNMAREVTNQIIEYGEVRRGYIGAKFQDLDRVLIEAFGLSVEKGAVVVSVSSGSPSDQAGLEAGDVIVSVNGRKINGASDLRNRLGLEQPGNLVLLDCLKSKTLVSASLTVGDYKDALKTKQFKNSVLSGVSVVAIPNSSEVFGRIRGVMIFNVQKKSKAWAAGLRKGDIISSVNRRDVRNVEQFLDAFNNSREKVLLRVFRDGNSALVMVQ